MKQSFMKGIRRNALLIIAFVAFIIFSGNKNPGMENDITARCCTGYDIAIEDLKKFMIDSLHGDQFEGGVYSKSKLLAAINKIPGDSVYLLNALKNCDVSKGTDIALTSPLANGVVFVKKLGCTPCPGKACCTPRYCATRINRSCIDYKDYQRFAGLSAVTGTTKEK